ncbi:hypothetical protein AB6D87_24575 [Vibrio lentus]
MNIKQSISLIKVPLFDEDIVVTRCADGSPLSYIYSPIWDYIGIEKGGVNGRTTVVFNSIDNRFRKAVQSTTWYICKEYKGRHKIALSSSQVRNLVAGLGHICVTLDSCDWTILSDDRVYSAFERKLKKHIEELDLSRATFDRVVRALNLLDTFDLCSRRTNSSDLGKKVKFKLVQQSLAIPVKMYQTMLSDAIKTVETYHEHRHEIARVMSAFYVIYGEEKTAFSGSQYNPSQLNKRVYARVAREIQHNIPDFIIDGHGKALGRIMRQCFLVTVAFSGARLGEVLSMSKDSYITKLSNGNEVPVLQGKTTKGNGGIPKTETWQTHPIVKDALELAFYMTENLRRDYKCRIDVQRTNGELTPEGHQRALEQINSAFLALKPGRVKSKYVQTALPRGLTDLVSSIVASQVDVDEFNRLNPSRYGQLKKGEPLHKLSPHDFRRTFAVFLKRYGFGSSATIRFQYKHRNINMSSYYANNAVLQAMDDVLLDADLLKVMSEEGISMAVDTFDEIYNKSKCLSGIEGERIAKDKYEKLKNGHDVYMTRTEIEAFIRNGSLSLVKLPTGGYCTNATCSRVCGIEQFSAEKKPCDHQIITDSQAKVILRQNNRLIKTFRALNTGDPLESSNLIALKQKIMRNEVTLKKHNLKFEAFADEVKSVIATLEV